MYNDTGGILGIYADGDIMVGGVGISFGHYETDPDTGTQSWVPQYYRKYGNKSLGITIRQRFSTVDTPAP